MLYFAAPLFNRNERSFNASVVSQLEQHVQIFLPQRDGSLLSEMIEAGVPIEVAQRRVFEQDLQAMRKASGLIAVLDGGHIDEGVAFELGFMSSLNRVCVGLQTDVRRALPSGNNPMIGGALHRIFDDVCALADWVATFSSESRASG